MSRHLASALAPVHRHTALRWIKGLLGIIKKEEAADGASEMNHSVMETLPAAQ
jgi:hypothetical protein